MPRVLIIEDDAENRRAMAQFFSREDWNVLEAKDGDAGLELALRSQPELILCDLLMPKSNGFEVCRSIREQLQPTKIIVVSGRDYGVDRSSALEAGADEYLLKPVTWELLSGTIDRLLPEIPRRPDPKSVSQRESIPARIRLWGVRGSIPVPGKGTVHYGGNTSCVEVRADGEIIILDAGSGIRLLGLALDKEFGPRSMKLTLLISHTHWDHIQGLPFFSPAYDQKNLIRVLGYEGARAGLAKILASQMETPFFPVSLRELPSHLAIEELKEMEFRVGPVKVRSKFANHPGICVGYRLATSSGSIAYFPDNEPYEQLKLLLASRDGITEEEARDFAAAERGKMVDFLEGCDVAIMDTQYTEAEYAKHVGWGHSSVESVVSLALVANVGKLILFHHDPNHDDQMIDKMVEHARAFVANSGKSLEVDAAREGAEILLDAKVKVAA
jgi:phosphoribosyl 1,2-cyclic phosphodiesterase/ActR/RegA family two-component response regulator